MQDASQVAFDFIQPLPWRPRQPEAVFFCLRLPAGVAARVDALAADFIWRNGLFGDRIERSRLHVTLHQVGRYTRLRSARLYGAHLAGASIRLPPVEAILDRITSFPPAPTKKKWPLVLLTEGDSLHAFHATLATEMRRQGYRAADNFTPHVTLQYGLTRIVEQPIEPIRVVFDEFFLIHSEKGLGRYNELDRWPFRASGGSGGAA